MNSISGQTPGPGGCHWPDTHVPPPPVVHPMPGFHVFVMQGPPMCEVQAKPVQPVVLQTFCPHIVPVHSAPAPVKHVAPEQAPLLHAVPGHVPPVHPQEQVMLLAHAFSLQPINIPLA